MHKRSGQSLIESIVAISLLVTGLLGILTLLSRSFFLTRVTEDETKGTYLAEEGIELAKNLIDHDVYLFSASPSQGLGWGACFPFSSGSNDYELDYTTVNCPPASYTGRNLKFDATTGLYSYTTGAATGFTRRIRITKPASNPNNEIDVQSIVSWSTGLLSSQSITLEDHFLYWEPASTIPPAPAPAPSPAPSPSPSPTPSGPPGPGNPPNRPPPPNGA